VAEEFQGQGRSGFDEVRSLFYKHFQGVLSDQIDRIPLKHLHTWRSTFFPFCESFGSSKVPSQESSSCFAADLKKEI
jgi:hypothetical protein